MDQKKIDEALETPKTGAVDTGKRIDINAARPATVRRQERPAPRVRAPKPKEVLEEKVVITREELKKPQAQTTFEPVYVEPMEFDESGDFASMLAESDSTTRGISYKMGDKVSGPLVHIGKDHSFVALGPKLEAAIATAELMTEQGQLKFALKDIITAYVISTFGGVTLSNKVSQGSLDDSMLQEALANRIPVEGKVTAVNKGGFDILISGKRAFCPVGQIDLRFVEDTSGFIDRTLSFLIERIEEGGKNIVVSRKALLQREQRQKAAELVKDIEVGKKYSAVITRVADFGAFADIGGLEGLIPRSEISHGHIDRISDIVSSNDRVEVVVLNFELNPDDPTKSRLSFSLKKAKEDPYATHWDKIKVGQTLEGRVVRLEAFGAFVELFPGIDGLIHISELSENRVAHPKEVLSLGDPVSVRILSINENERRIGLSLREAVVKKKSGDKQENIKVERGQKASGVISRIERYGIFLELNNGASALLPESESGLPKHSDLSRAFKLGDTLDVVIIDIDAQNRIRASLIARKQMEERDSYLEFQSKENQRSASFGSFADLLKKRR
jgi:small subunit ribosomal protein S1